MRRFFTLVFLTFLLLPTSTRAASLDEQPLLEEPIVAETEPPTFYRAKVLEVLEEIEREEIPGYRERLQRLRIRLLTGPEKGQEVEMEHGGIVSIEEVQKVRAGQHVVVTKTSGLGEDRYFVMDVYRLPALAWITAAFFALAVILGGKRGTLSILGLILTFLILLFFVVPQILGGSSPVTITVLGSLGIATLSIFLAHGVNRRTSVAVVSTVVILLLGVGAAAFGVWVAGLTGIGKEETFYLQLGPLGGIDFRGLLLSGIIIGILGVLDDITTSLAAAVDELHKANPALPWRDIARRALSIGREHIASLVNTLILAYVGASFPLFLLLAQTDTQPLWVTLNSELIAEEVVRSVVGGISLFLAVPFTTYLASWYLTRGSRVQK